MIISPSVITIDGPSGVGKGALCRELFKKLHWNILDSGAIYRILALEAFSRGLFIDINSNKEKLLEIASGLDITFINRKNGLDIFFRGKNINHEIYTETIGNLASKIAVFPEVRKILLEYQQTFCVFPGLIANGRDMGTIVFPRAMLKIFLYASSRVRSKRRFLQLKKNGFNVSLDFILEKIKERDYRDCTRKVAPLIPAVDSLILDSSDLSLHEIAYTVLKYFYNTGECVII